MWNILRDRKVIGWGDMSKEYEVGIEAKERLRQFEKELMELLNKYGMESYSKTPDYILAGYLVASLTALNVSVVMRDNWHEHG